MDDHLPHRKMGEVELADALIRLLDFGGAYGLKHLGLDTTFNNYSNQSPAKWHFLLNQSLFTFGNIFINYTSMRDGGVEMIDIINEYYSRMTSFIIHVSTDLGYDIWGALDEKLAYNAKRLDHKRENRQKKGGKEF